MAVMENNLLATTNLDRHDVHVTSEMRPLGALSNFVVSEFPEILERLRDKVSTATDIAKLLEQKLDAYSLSDQIDELIHTEDPNRSRVAALDLAILTTGLEKHKVPIPTHIQSGQNRVCSLLGIPTCLTYELIVLANPLEDLRTFTRSEIGKAEQLFYADHSAVERSLLPAVESIGSAVGLLSLDAQERFASRCVSLICNAQRHYIRSREQMKHFYGGDEISVEAFSVFRQYLNGNQEHPGPSGLFSPGEHSLRLLTFGTALPDRIRLVERLIVYFPSEDQAKLIRIAKAASRGESLYQILKDPKVTLSSDVRIVVRELMEQIVEGMKDHLSFVKRYLGQNVPGTAGMSFEFLENGVGMAASAVDEVKNLEKPITES